MSDFRFNNDLNEWKLGKNTTIGWLQRQAHKTSLFYVCGKKKNGNMKKFKIRFAFRKEANKYGSQLVSSGKILSFQVCKVK